MIEHQRTRPVAVWLFAMAALIALMVCVGGATRLTDSGLSIVEWRPVTGAIPPLSDADWAREFAKYPVKPRELEKLRSSGWTVLAAVAQPDAPGVREFGATRALPERVCLVLGSEGYGLSAAARAAADACVTISMRAGFDSLNVAAASAILLHHFSRAERAQ